MAKVRKTQNVAGRSSSHTAGPSSSSAQPVKTEASETFGGKRLCELLANKQPTPDDPNEQVVIDSFVGSIRHFTGSEIDELL